MERRIFVPLDGSALAETVLPHAAILARASSSTLRLIYIVPPAESMLALPDPALVPPITLQRWVEEERARGHAYLEQVANRLRAPEIPVEFQVLVGADLAATIVDCAAHDARMWMITMATHGRSGLRSLLMGSVAEKVLQAAPVPLLLVRAHETPTTVPAPAVYTTMVVPLDGSPFAEQALAIAKPLAVATGATLVVLSVGPAVDDVGLAEGGVEPYWMLADQQAASEQLASYLRDTARQLAAGLSVQTHHASGRPAEEILRVSRQVGADLIIMTTHGRTGVRRLWLGSVALEVVRGADLPVLLVRAQEAAKQTKKHERW